MGGSDNHKTLIKDNWYIARDNRIEANDLLASINKNNLLLNSTFTNNYLHTYQLIMPYSHDKLSLDIGIVDSRASGHYGSMQTRCIDIEPRKEQLEE